MIIKRYLPFRFSREGYLPDRLHLQFFDGSAEQCEEQLTARNKTAHYHLSKEGIITALTPISAAANLLSAIQEVPGSEEPSPARRGILILIEGNALCPEQTEPLLRLLKGIQKEFRRIYGESFPFCRGNLVYNESLPVEELLEQGFFPGDSRTLFRVQTGTYKNRKDAEESIQRLQRAGIAAYVTEVKGA